MTAHQPSHAARAALTLALLLSACGGDDGTDIAGQSSSNPSPAPDRPGDSLPPSATFASELPGGDSYLDDLPTFDLVEVDMATPTTISTSATTLFTEVSASSTVAPKGPHTCEIVTLHGAFFLPDVADLTDAGLAQLDLVALQLLNGSRLGDLVVVGWTDPRPTSFPGGNETLSKARATAVHDALIARGVPVARLREPLGMGPDPADLPDAQRRRVEVHILC